MLPSHLTSHSEKVMKLLSIILSFVLLTACSSSNDSVEKDIDSSAIAADASTSADNTASTETPVPTESAMSTDTSVSSGSATPTDTDTDIDIETAMLAEIEPPTDSVTLTPELEFPVNDLLVSLAGYQSEVLAEKVLLISENIESIADNKVVITDNQVDVEETTTTTSNKSSYSCSAGGQLIVETINSEDRQVHLSRTTDSVNYTFEQCVMSVENDNLENGVYRMNGTFKLAENAISSRAVSYSIRRQWDLFSIVNPDSSSESIDGNTIDSNESSGDSKKDRSVGINHYEHLIDDQIIFAMKDVSMDLQSGTRGSRYINFYELNISGEIQGLMTLDNLITISTEPALSHRTTAQPEIDPPTFTGGMQMISDSGSNLMLSAVQTITSEKTFSYSYTSAAGDTVTADEQELVNLFDFAPES